MWLAGGWWLVTMMKGIGMRMGGGGVFGDDDDEGYGMRMGVWL